jgi:hypothetical protein
MALLYDELDLDFRMRTSTRTGVEIFDRLPFASKLAMLEIVGKALYCPSEACPDRSALLEATVAAVFAGIRSEVVSETIISSDWFPPDFFRMRTRRLVVEAFLETHPECAVPISTRTSDAGRERPFVPKPSCTDMQIWDALLCYLTDALIGRRRDFKYEMQFLDSDPDITRQLKSQRSIPDGYYTTIAPEPGAGDDIRSTAKRLRRLFGRNTTRARRGDA